MRDFTNLAWPETPFGADQRPFGRRVHMLTAIDVAWGRYSDADALVPRCSSVVYLRVHPAQQLTVKPATLPIGFRATVLDASADLDHVLGVLDRALVRARRHAFMLAGRQLGAHLARLDELSTCNRPGIEALLHAWDGRDTKVRGIARFHDVADDHSQEPVDADLDGAPPLAEPVPATVAATDGLVRCLAIALTAGWQTDLLRWEGAFPAQEALAVAGWDILGTPTEATTE
jgi:hypothetical protein